MIEEIIRGSIRKPQAAQALEKIIRNEESISGKMLYGYPVSTEDGVTFQVDAVIVSDRGLPTVIDLVQEDDPGDYGDRQDHAYNLVKCKLQMDPRLTRKRTLLVDLQTVTFWTQSDQDDESDPERPIVGPAGILDFIGRHQAREQEDLDPEVVMNAVMFMGRYEQ